MKAISNATSSSTCRDSQTTRQVIAIKSRRSGTVIAYAFDIDGVLVRSKTPIDGAARILSRLQKHKIPFIFLTNGGGTNELDHVSLLGSRLGLTFDVAQFVQSHSPYHDLVPQLADKNILVLGGVGNKIRDVAHDYGFKHVVTSSDIAKAYPNIYPFLEISRDYHDVHGLSEELLPSKNGNLNIHAILVWSSPRDWGLDLQIITDLLLSERGKLCTRSKLNGNEDLPNHGYLQDGQPAIYFCNPDLTWATAYIHPRAAQGYFRAALQGVWAAKTKNSELLNAHTVGKPTRTTYEYGEKILNQYHEKLHGSNAKPISKVYMIGDNPLSDIRGANDYVSNTGATWKSILVETGVYKEGDVPAVHPEAIVEDVERAVNWAMEQEGLEWSQKSQPAEKEEQSA